MSVCRSKQCSWIRFDENKAATATAPEAFIDSSSPLFFSTDKKTPECDKTETLDSNL